MPSCLLSTSPNCKKADLTGLISLLSGVNLVVLAVEVLGGLAVLLVHLYGPAVNELGLSLFGAEGNLD